MMIDGNQARQAFLDAVDRERSKKQKIQQLIRELDNNYNECLWKYLEVECIKNE